MPNVTIEWVEGRDKKEKAEVARKIVEVLDQVAGASFWPLLESADSSIYLRSPWQNGYAERLIGTI